MTGLGPGEWYVDKATIYVPFCVFAYLRLSTQRLFFSRRVRKVRSEGRKWPLSTQGVLSAAFRSFSNLARRGFPARLFVLEFAVPLCFVFLVWFVFVCSLAHSLLRWFAGTLVRRSVALAMCFAA